METCQRENVVLRTSDLTGLNLGCLSYQRCSGVLPDLPGILEGRCYV
jgi:hypothetical protein